MVRFHLSLGAALASVLGACSSNGPNDNATCGQIELESLPIVASVLVADVTATDPYGSRFVLTYGFNPFINTCATDVDCDLTSGFRCGDDCSAASGHCVDAAGRVPHATHAVARASTKDVPGSSIHIVSATLVDGRTVERADCACRAATIAGDTCPDGHAFSPDPVDCSICGDSPATPSIDESGMCLDENGDGLPDRFTLLPGIVTITCGTFLVHANTGDEGEFYPSGSMFPSSVTGYAGIGPHIAIQPSIDLPTNSDCKVTLAPTVTAESGHPIEMSGPASFHTESLDVAEAVPANHATGVSRTSALTLTFNSSLRVDSVTAENLYLAEDAGRTVPAGVTVSGRVVTITPAGSGLAAGTKYVVVVRAQVADSYGKAMPTDRFIYFTTAP